MQNSSFPPGAQAAAYLRDSGHEDQELSITQQENVIRDHCLKNGILLTRLFIDEAQHGSSAARRPAFQQMLTYFRTTPPPPETGIIVWKLNRFARNLTDAQRYKSELRMLGITIQSLNDNIPAGLDGLFFETAIDWMSARYIEDLRVDIKRGLYHVLKQHGALGGTPPIGFIRQTVEIGTRRDGRSHLVSRWAPDPQKTDLIKRAFEMRAAGASYLQIHNELHLYKTKSCYPNFFKNKLYIGTLSFGSSLISDYCEPIIDPKTWELVQERQSTLAVNSENHPRRISSAYILSGLARCANCNSPMNGTNSTAKGHRYESYICSNAKRFAGCTATSKIPRKELETAVINRLVEFYTDAQNLQLILQQTSISNANAKDKGSTVIKTHQAELRKTKTQIDRLTDLLTNEDNPNPRPLLERLASLDQHRAELELTIKNLQIKQQDTFLQLDPAKVSQYSQQIVAHLLSETNLENKKLILHGLISQVIIQREDRTLKGRIDLTLPAVFKQMTGDEVNFTTGQVVPIQECPRRGTFHSLNIN